LYLLLASVLLPCRQVVYSAEALLDKNKDFVVAEHAALIRNSASYFVRCALFFSKF